MGFADVYGTGRKRSICCVKIAISDDRKRKTECIRPLDSAESCDGILSASVSTAVRAVKEDGKKSV